MENSQGDKVFYLVQSKWNSIGNCDGQFENEVLKSYLSDVQSILRGDKENTTNEKFNSRYRDLLAHVKGNGEVKVLYLTLKNDCVESNANIKSFESCFGGKVTVDCFDIKRLKLDYIDRNFKKSSPPNPLEKVYSPEFEKITLSIVQDDERNLLKVDKPYPAHVFNILPKTIYELVQRYGVSLFDKNVRNPLVSSKINNEIVNSLKNDPSSFWYYNNGITAITKAIPGINSQAESFQVTGLQIINGAQTAYSIYLAYSEATLEEREIIDAEARITLRLLKSGGKDFDLKVTKFTNSQNPVSERDFWSTDPLQTKIQNYFYGTNIWYEKRSGEFRKKPKGVIKVPNNIVASAHLAFWLSKPVSVFEATMRRESNGLDLIFTSYKENKDGLYETIFNKETQSEQVFASFCMFDIITDAGSFDFKNVFFSNAFHILSISRLILKKYLDLKFNANVSLCAFIIKAYKKDEKEIIKKCIQYSSILMKNEFEAVTD
ncbi:MAG: AIPR family protein, partial [Marinomonadaceae bacterium]